MTLRIEQHDGFWFLILPTGRMRCFLSLETAYEFATTKVHS